MDWATIFINDTTWEFATEILLRCVMMYAMIILFLRLTGKRGVRQLSIFEVTIILALGSIAGDPMFTEDIPLIQAVLVMSVIIVMYRLTTWLMMKYQWFEDLLEGKPIYIVEDGVLVVEEIKKVKCRMMNSLRRCVSKALNTWVRCAWVYWKLTVNSAFCISIQMMFGMGSRFSLNPAA